MKALFLKKHCLPILLSLLLSPVWASTTMMTSGSGQYENHLDQIASATNNDGTTSSVNNFETKIESSQSSVPQSSPPVSSSSISSNTAALINSEPDSESQAQLLMVQTSPGQFMSLLNRENAPGHVTMIGYTTPIVKFGDPIPLEQYLKEQRHVQKQDQQATSSLMPQSMLSSATSRQQFTNIITRMTGTPTTSPSPVATASVDVPLRLILTNNNQEKLIPGQKATLIQTASSVQTKSNEEQKLINQHNQNNQVIFDDIFHAHGPIEELRTQSDQQQQPKPLDLLQQQEQFAAPLEKPRPFLVYKPGFRNNQKLLQQFQIQHEMAQPQVASNLVQSKSSQLTEGGNELKLVQNGHLISSLSSNAEQSNNENEQSPNSFAGLHPLSSPHQQLNPVSPLIRQNLTPIKANHFELAPKSTNSMSGLSPVKPHFQHPFKSNMFSNNVLQIGQAQSSFLRSAGGKSDEINELENSGGSSVDTRAELQNQIKHVLATSPNLSEDSRVRHRDAIMKAVQSLVGSTTSSHHSATITDEEVDKPLSPKQDMMSRFAGFPQFHPKSMLFQFPKSTPIVSSFLNNKQHFNNFQQPNTQSFLSKFPSLLPGFQPSGVITPQAIQPSKSSVLPSQPQLISTETSQQTEQKIQSQIQQFLQHNPQQQLSSLNQHLQQPTLFSNLIEVGQNQQPESLTSRLIIDDNHPIFSTQPKIFVHSNKIRLAPGLLLSSEDSPSTHESSPTDEQSESGKKMFLTSSSLQQNHNTKPNQQSQQQASTLKQQQVSLHHHLSSYQPEVNIVTPKTTMRGYSEWWKERALAETHDTPRHATIAMLTQLPA